MMADTSETRFDLLIRAGRVFCPGNGWDGPSAVGIRDGRIMATGQQVDGTAEKVLDYPDDLLLPGLVDLHAHPARGLSKYGVDPDLNFLPRGVTTVMSQGDAGAHNWDEYRETVAKSSKTRVIMALNLSGPGESREQGCFENLEDADVDACVESIRDGGNDVWGIAINTSLSACNETDPREILFRAVAAAERADVPLLFGSRRHSDVPLAQQLTQLRSGDVLTYCFHPEAEGLTAGGHIRDGIWQARERGVLFDVGHGMGSFSFEVAEQAIADGFFPDTISTDQYKGHVGSNPQHDLPRTLSKLIAAGMPESDAFVRATLRSSKVLGLEDEVGCLSPGKCADLAVLRWNESAAPLADTQGVERPGGCWEPIATVRAGEIVAQ